ncbi:MAG: hypothetical protein PHX78_01820 [bacterium]|nr:hypothetical protein [bacterium]
MDRHILNKLNINKIDFCNEPVLYDIGDYYKAIEHYLDKIIKTNEVKSVIQVGDISIPGISDIDLILILEKEIKTINTDIFSIFQLSKKDIHLFLHEPMIFNIDLIKNIYYWSPYPKFKYIYGEDLKIDRPAEDEAEIIATIILIEYFIMGYPRKALEMILNRRIRVREALCYINGIKYSIEILESLTGKSLNYGKFLKDYNDFRFNWFNESDRNNILFNYLLETIEISFNLINVLSNYLNRKSDLSNNVSVPQYPFDFKAYLDRQFFTVFSNGMTIDKWLECIIDFYQGTGIVSVILPEMLFPLIETYSNINQGIVSKHISRFLYDPNNMGTYQPFDGLIKKTAEYKIKFLDDHINYLKHNKLLNRSSNINSFGCPIDDNNSKKLLRPLKKQYHQIRMIRDLYFIKKHKKIWGY